MGAVPRGITTGNDEALHLRTAQRMESGPPQRSACAASRAVCELATEVYTLAGMLSARAAASTIRGFEQCRPAGRLFSAGRSTASRVSSRPTRVGHRQRVSVSSARGRGPRCPRGVRSLRRVRRQSCQVCKVSHTGFSPLHLPPCLLLHRGARTETPCMFCAGSTMPTCLP